MKRLSLGWVACVAVACSSRTGANSSGIPEPFPPPSSSSTGEAGAAGASAGISMTEPVIVADTPPPLLSGGTLLIQNGDKTAIVSDPDHDQVVVVDLVSLKVARTIRLEPGDEPGRITEDAVGRVHVILRGAGAFATIDPQAGKVLSRRTVCLYPRGIAYDAKTDAVHVACAGGELASFPAANGAATRTIVLDRDLRDVAVHGEHLWVTRFPLRRGVARQCIGYGGVPVGTAVPRRGSPRSRQPRSRARGRGQCGTGPRPLSDSRRCVANDRGAVGWSRRGAPARVG